MRDRLIELINEEIAVTSHDNGEFIETEVNVREIADHLLAAGVIVPPCKVGGTLWIIKAYANSRLEIINRTVEPIEVGSVAISKEGVEIETEEAIYFPEHFGKFIFFAREEAERALAERREG